MGMGTNTYLASVTQTGTATLNITTGSLGPVTAANPLPVISSGESTPSVTPAPGTTSTIATGGTAITLATGPLHGGYVTNPPNTASQGVSAENAYVDPVASPGSTDSAANGTTSLLTPGQSFTIPALAAGALLRGNAATTGHKFTVVTW